MVHGRWIEALPEVVVGEFPIWMGLELGNGIVNGLNPS